MREHPGSAARQQKTFKPWSGLRAALRCRKFKQHGGHRRRRLRRSSLTVLDSQAFRSASACAPAPGLAAPQAVLGACGPLFVGSPSPFLPPPTLKSGLVLSFIGFMQLMVELDLQQDAAAFLNGYSPPVSSLHVL